MIERTKSLEKEYLFLLLAAIPTITPFIIDTDFYEKPELAITVLELKNQVDEVMKTSEIETVIHNIGNVPVHNIVVYYKIGSHYEITSYESPDGNYQNVYFSNKQLSVHISKLSPDSYAVIKTSGVLILNDTRMIWLTSDESKTLAVELPKTIHGGITTLNFQIGSSIIYLSMFTVLIALAGTRYYVIRQHNSKRLRYSLNLKYLRPWSGRFFVCVIFVFASHFIIAYYYNSNLPISFHDYHPLQEFELNQKITEKVFLDARSQMNQSTLEWIIGLSMIITEIGVFIVISDTRNRRTQWRVDNNTEANVFVNEINMWYTKYQIVPISCQKKIVKRSTGIIVLIDNNREIVGLISKMELDFLKMNKKSTFEDRFMKKPSNRIKNYNVFMKIKNKWSNLNEAYERKLHLYDELDDPRWNETLNKRTNFVTVKPNNSIKEVRDEMEKHSSRFAIIRDERKCIVGVLDHNRL